MKNVKIDLATPLADSTLKHAVGVLRGGGLVCAPCCGTYRILADLMNPDAVMRLMQSKRRTGKAPALVFISSAAKLSSVAIDLEPGAQKVADAFWPGAVTLLVDPSGEIPAKVRKLIAPKRRRIGVRVPEDVIGHQICKEFGGPLLVSSANKANKSGEESLAQVQRTFLGRIDLMLDADDLRKQHRSSVVDVRDGELTIQRPGLIEEDAIRAVFS